MASQGEKKTFKDWGRVLHHSAGLIVCVFGECIGVGWIEVYGVGFRAKRFSIGKNF